MQLNRTLLTILLLSFFTGAFAQQKYPSTLLWRITGKGLSHPSYLYGTMHVQDRRLFYFGDSLYSAIEKTESFAMEINPDDMMDSLFRSLEKKDTSAFLKKILSDAEYKRIAKQLEKKLKIPADQITVKKLAAEKRKAYNVKRKDDMPTVMDLYLFMIARNQGKVTGGIEDINDQLDIMNEVGAVNIDDFVKADTVMQMSYLERMKQVYINRDLTTLDEMVNGKYNEAFKDIFLVKRNVKMALRIDSLSHVRSGFFAVGAAHLPGEAGVINLLQQKGFTVEPVLSSHNIAPEEYKYTAAALQWQKVEDDNKFYTVSMPGKPSAFVADNTLPMKMYVDLSDISYYGIGVTPVADNEANPDSLFTKIINNYKRMGFDIKSTKNITYKDAKGIEMYAVQAGDNHFRYRVLLKDDKLFIIIFGANQEGNIKGANAEKYLNSLVFGDDLTGGKKNWKSFTSDKSGFRMMVPGKIEIGKEDPGDEVKVDKYSAVDYSDGTYYVVTVQDTRPGYYINDDSTVFIEYKNGLNESTKGGVKEFSIQPFKNFPACHFVAFQKENNIDYALQGYLVRRNNRTYLALVVGKKERVDFPEVSNFFRNFELTAFKQEGWSTQRLDLAGLSTFAPTAFTALKKDSSDVDTDAEKMIKYVAVDKNTGVGYSIEVEPLSTYYWNKSDSSFFKERAEGFKAYGDSIISYTYNNEAVKNATVLIKLHDSPLYKKLSLFLNGDTTYTLYSFQTEEILKVDYFDRFYKELRFAQTYPVTIFNNKATALLTALQSSDSVKFLAAKKALSDADFAKENLPLLYTAVVKKYKKDEEDYTTVNDRILDKIIALKDSSVVDFVTKNYRTREGAEDMQMQMLKLLALQKTKPAYTVLQDLMLHQPPVKGSPYMIVYSMTDSLELMKDFFPAATSLYSDTTIGAAVIKIGNELLDSNMVQPADILQNEKGLYALANKQLEEWRKDKEAYPVYNSEVISLLGRFNTKESNALLNRFCKVSDLWIKKDAVLALLKNKQPVAAADIMKFAVDKEWRARFYALLKKIDRSDLFPKAFYTQPKFAESYLYSILSDDEELAIKTMQLVKTKTAVIDGKQQRFYIFKVTPDDDDHVAHLAICGPFNNNTAIADIDDADLDTYYDYDDEFSATAIDKKFETYIADKQKVKQKVE